LLFSNTLTSRLKLLVRNMSMIRDGKFEVFVGIEDQDEIGMLSKSFSNMVNRINLLIKEVYVSELQIKDLEIKTKEAKFNALQSQMNPHFLFNTMESIRMNLLGKRDYETSEIIQTFAKLLRKSMDWSRDMITLSQELELVEQYLKVQQYRYRERIQYIIDIDETLKQHYIPKFTLQPVVENAIYHGIEMKEHAGKCWIDAGLEGSDLIIRIRDDGVGMESEKLENVKKIVYAEDDPTGENHIGLRNVHMRLKLNYGDGYGIMIESVKDAGTIIQLRIPLQNGGKSDV
jgi:two-component system sensor histidine kinase YesM